MNWHHWHKQLSRMADTLSDQMVELSAESKLQNPVWLAEEFRHRPLIDEICKQYAETNTWPINMSQTQKILIYFRLVEGANHAESMAQGQHVPNLSSAELDSEIASALNLLLVDYWHSGGRAKWLAS
jgi:hypothetical protein